MARAKDATGVNTAAMPLRSSNVGGLVTAVEWNSIASLMGSGARVMSLLPVELALAAMLVYGR